MSSKDERVVEMRFDNAQFERGIKESMKTIDQFEKSLKMEGIAKSLSNIEKAAGKFSLQGISNAVNEGIRSFGALGVAGVTAISNITNQAIAAGQRMMNDAIQPVRAGFSEYETQINAVQTILANTSSKGTTLDQVNEALDELNEYADKTIYNFTQMTENIGRFTAAGVGLEDSVTAIKGISNLAAASGADAGQAARAMYNLSQALSMGRLTLMDWNSVVNAGMGGEMFQESLKETARVHGVAVDEMIAKQGSFRDSLSEGWITSEILLETLQKFTGDLSDEQLRSLGYTEDQIKAIQELGEMANDSATKVKTITQLFDTWNESKQSGWTQTWELLIGDFEEARSILTDISNILNGMTERSAKRRNDFLGEILGTSKLDSYSIEQWEKFAETGFATDELKTALIANARESGIAIDDLLAKYGSFEQTLQEGWLTKSLFDETVNATTTDAETMGKSLEDLKQVVEEVENGLWGNADTGRFEKLAEAGWDWHLVQQLVDQDLQGGGVDWENLTEEQLASLGATEEQVAAFKELRAAMADSNSAASEALHVETGREMILRSIMNVISGVSKVLNIIRVAWNNAFPAASVETIQSLIKAFADWTEKLDISGETSVRIFNIFTGLFNALGLIVDVGGVVVDVIKNLFDAFPKGDDDFSVLEMLSNAAQGITEFRNSLKGSGKLENAVERITEVLLKFADACATAFDEIKRFIAGEDVNFTFLQKIREWFSNIFSRIRQFNVNGALDKLKSFLAGKGIDTKWIDDIKKGLNDLFGKDSFIGNLRTKFGKWLSEVFKLDGNLSFREAFSQLASRLRESVSNVFSNLFGDFHPIQAIQEAISNFSFGDISFDSIVSSISGGWETVKGFFEGLDINLDPLETIQSKIGAFIEWVKSLVTGGSSNSVGTPMQATKRLMASMTLTDSTSQSDINVVAGIIDRIGSALEFFGQNQFVQSAIDLLGQIPETFNTLKEKISEFKIEDLEQVFTDIKDKLSGFYTDLMTSLDEISKSPAAQSVMSSLNSIKEFFESLAPNIEAFTTSKFGETFNEVKQNISEFFSGISDSLEEFGRSQFVQSAGEFLSSTLQTLKDIARVYATFELGRFLNDLGSGIDSITGKVDESKGELLIKIAASLAILSYAVSQLSKIEDFDSLVTGLEGLAGAVGALVGSTFFTGIFGKIKGFDVSGVSEIAIATAIAILAKVVVAIAEYKDQFGPEDITFAVGVIEQLTGLMSVLDLFAGDAKLKIANIFEFELGGITAGTGIGELGIVTAIGLMVGLAVMVAKQVREGNINPAEVTNAANVISPMAFLLQTLTAFNREFKIGWEGGVFEIGSFGASEGFGELLIVAALKEMVPIIEETRKIKRSEALDAAAKLAPMVGIIETVVAIAGALDALNTVLGGKYGTGPVKGLANFRELIHGGEFYLIAQGLTQLIASLGDVGDINFSGFNQEGVDKFTELIKFLAITVTGGALLDVAAGIAKIKTSLFGFGFAFSMGMLGVGGIATGLGAMTQGLATIFDQIVTLSEGDYEKAMTRFPKTVDMAFDAITAAISNEEYISRVQRAIGAFGGEALMSVLKAPFELGIFLGEQLMRAIDGDISEADIENARGTLQSVVDTIFDPSLWPNAWEVAKEFGKQLWDGIYTGFLDAVAKNPVIGAIWDTIVGPDNIQSDEFVLDVSGQHVLLDTNGEPISVHDAIVVDVDPTTSTVRFGENTLPVDRVYSANYDGLYMDYSTGRVFIDASKAEQVLDPNSIRKDVKFDYEGTTYTINVPLKKAQANVRLPDGENVQVAFDAESGEAFARKIRTDLMGSIEDISGLKEQGYEVLELPDNERIRAVIKLDDMQVEADPNSMPVITESTVSDFETAAEPLGEAIDEGVNTGMENNTSALSQGVTTLKDAAVEFAHNVWQWNSPSKIFIPLGESVPEGIALGMNQGGSFILTALNNMANAMLTVTRQYPPQFTPIGVEVINSLANGIATMSGLPAIYARIAMENAANAVQGFRYQFVEAGRYAAEGLAEGIRIGGSSAITAAINMATSSIKAAKATLDENSPSRVFREIGLFGSLGMALGFDDGERNVEESSSGVANRAVEAVRNTFALLDSIVDGTFELNPVIAPVLDLSNMRNADMAIGRLLGHSFDETSARIDAAHEASSNRSEDYNTLNIYVDGAVVNDDEEIRNGALNMLYGLKRKAAL